MPLGQDEVDRQIRAVLRFLGEELKLDIAEAVFFGSHLDGTADEWSDIDLAVFARGIDELDPRQRVKMAVRAEDSAAPNVELHLYDAARLEQARPTNWYGHIRAVGRRVA